MVGQSQPARMGPAVADTMAEVEGIFPSETTLQAAVSNLTLAGFDRADLSLPAAAPLPEQATPKQGAATVNTETDAGQARTLTTGLAASAAGMAAAAAVIASGGAAVAAVGAAAAAGMGAGALSEAASSVLQSATRAEREQAARRGTLVLSVRMAAAERQTLAMSLMRDAGASRVEAVRRANGTIEVTTI